MRFPPTGMEEAVAWAAVAACTAPIAAAMALDMPYIPAGRTFGLSGGFGFYGDETALSAAGAYRMNEHWQFNAGVAAGMDRGETGGRVGFSASW